MKKILILLMAALVLAAAAAGCAPGGISQSSLTVKAGGETLTLGQPTGQSEAEQAEMLDKYGVGLVEQGGSLNIIGLREKGPQLGCGVGVGDSVDKVLRTFGDNIAYDMVSGENSYSLQYFYYEKEGALVGISDRILAAHLYTLEFSDAEEEAFMEIKDEITEGDNYLVLFLIEEDMVVGIELSFYKDA